MIKALEKEDSNEKVIKIVKNLVDNLSSYLSTNNLMQPISFANKQQQQTQQQQAQNQQNEINCLIILGIVFSRRPEIFVQNISLTEVGNKI